MTNYQFVAGAGRASIDELRPSPGQKSVSEVAADSVALVFGAPATGKTTAIRLALRSLISRGLSSDEIQVVSATRIAANQLRDELALDLQAATTGPLAKTVTSLAFSLLSHQASLAGQPAPELISGSEQDFILSELIQSEVESAERGESQWPSAFTKQVLGLTGFRVELRDLLTSCLEHDIDPEKLRALSVQHQRPEWVAAAGVLERYLQKLGQSEHSTRFDASSLLVAATNFLQELSDWPNDFAKVRFVLVDDAQELTPASEAFLNALVSRGAGLVLIGDPDASTLGFRAANPQIMSQLASAVAAGRGTEVKRIFLESVNSRPKQLAEAMARSLKLVGTALAGPQRKALADSHDAENTGLVANTFIQPDDEIAWLARQLRARHLDDGLPFSEMAVVARSSEHLNRLERDLAANALPVRIFGAQSAFAQEFASGAILRLIETLYRTAPLEIETAIDLLTSPFCGVDQLALRRLRRALRRQELEAGGHSTSDQLICGLFDAEGSAVTVNTAEGRTVSRLLKWYFEAKTMAASGEASIEDLLWKVWSESRLESTWSVIAEGEGEVALQAHRNLDTMVALFASANRFAERNPGAEALIFVRQQLQLQLPEDTLANNDLDVSKVTLHTPSSLISQRYKLIAMPGLIEGVWPNLRPRSSLLGARQLDAIASGRQYEPTTGSELPDELRLFYKSLGAAAEEVILTATYGEDTQISQFFSIATQQIPKPTTEIENPLTLRALAGQLRRQLAQNPSGADAKSAALGLARLAEAGVAGAHPSSWYGLRELSTTEPLVDLAAGEEVGIRPSQLEAFLTCPLHWFLANHGGNESNFSANLGTLVHQALEIGTESDFESLWGLVESKWHTLAFESEWQDRAGRRRGKALVASMLQYLNAFEAAGGEVIGREVNFDFKIGQAEVRGQIDRIEKIGNEVTIVDLKTGKKSFTAEEAQNHVQLGLYQLAFTEGALSELEGLPEDATLAGAKLLLVSSQKPTTREQNSLETDEVLRDKIQEAIARATQGMSMTENFFVAELDQHCNNDQQYGTCQIHVTRAVSYVP